MIRHEVSTKLTVQKLVIFYKTIESSELEESAKGLAYHLTVMTVTGFGVSLAVASEIAGVWDNWHQEALTRFTMFQPAFLMFLRPSDKTPPDVRNDLVSWHGPVPMFLSIAIGGPVSDLCIV